MKPALSISTSNGPKRLQAAMAATAACFLTGSICLADAANQAAEPPASRPRVVAAAPQIDVQVIEVPEGGGTNPLRLRVRARQTDDDAPSAQERLKGARLGIALADVPDAVRAQLRSKDLPAGFGVMVQEVAEGSPAAKAEIEPFDILVKFDDQKLVSGEQLVALVSSAEANRPVPITLLRQGRLRVVKVRLAGAAGVTATPQQDATGQESDQQPKFPEESPGLPAIPGLPPQVQDMLKQLPENGFQWFGGAGSPFQANVSVQGSTIMTTDAGTVTITSSNGEQTVTITDKAGTKIYSGPLNTDEDWEQVPEDFRGMLPKP
jgi:membrane-associated protease RseP (regulator of RpoE activity)